MARQLQTEIASENPLVLELHQWRVSVGYSRAKTVDAIEEKTQFKIPMRTLENWEQGRNDPDRAVVILLRQFLDQVNG